jgi:transcriptional regulator with XRE-family HTH domain
MGIGKNVKALAKDRGLNLIELSKKSGVPLNTIYTLTGEDPRNATMRTLDRLAEALKVDVRTLQTGIEFTPEKDNRPERVKEKEGKLTKLILDIIKTLSTPEEIDWAHIEDLVIEAERLDNEIKEEK